MPSATQSDKVMIVKVPYGSRSAEERGEVSCGQGPGQFDESTSHGAERN